MSLEKSPHPNRFSRRLQLAGLFLFLLTLAGTSSAQAAVELIDFTAIPSDDVIILQWETATEIDNAGFYLHRKAQGEQEFTVISNFIPAEGVGVIGASYEWIDEQNLVMGTRYEYLLEAVDVNNQSEFHGPVEAVAGAEPSTPTATATTAVAATATATITPTDANSATPTVTGTLPTATASQTATRTPTRTPTPILSSTALPSSTPTGTVTLTQTPTPSATYTPSATALPTLVAPPAIILEQPSGPTPQSNPQQTEQQQPADSLSEQNFWARLIAAGNLGRIGLIVFIVLLWAAVAVGGYLYLNRRTSQE